MIEGSVNASLDSVIALDLRGPAGELRQADAVVDTGFSRFLTLPPSVVEELGLPFAGARLVILADGSEVALDAYAVTVLWDGRAREIVAYAADTTPLIGMSMLDGHSLYVEVEDRGRVVIQAR
ncbi:MAG: clan AA aspartic protease [Gemmatimonadetes bacterium]|nr:clan AA aspartic protease [Dehalococcoidia bacterium]MYA11029.1 clan AA aspartic protease [Gemmatimonadota bacterium]MYD29576.1 clan AA aspartic protease [Dehalococcoidia bacterium]MYE60847.1 clan AA aspartic protease [Candidatus Dadabacteria bacterium]MYJ68906.1 clan AA aspartic protease [Gemmatimonadota bacterium]